MSTNRPVHQIRMGQVRAAIWANQSDFGLRFSVTFERTYFREESKSLETVHSYGPQDAMVLAELARQAALWMYAEQCSPASADAPVLGAPATDQ